MGFVEFSGVFGVGFVNLEFGFVGIFRVWEPWFVGIFYVCEPGVVWASILQGTMTPILWWGHLMVSIMTNLVSTVVVRGFSGLGG